MSNEELAPFETDDANFGATVGGASSQAPEPTPEVPAFEGKEVASAVVEFTGSPKGLADDPDLVLSVDDRVRFAGVYRVTEVRHVVDPTTGDLVRKQILRPVTMDRIPFDPSDPDDDGVLRG